MSKNNLNIFSNLHKHKNRVALYEDNNLKYTYEDLLNFGKNFQFLKGKKSLTILMCNNSFESVSAYVNLVRFDQAVFLISDQLEEFLFLEILNKYKPKFLFLSKKFNFYKIKKYYKKKKKFKKNIFYELKKPFNYQIFEKLALLLLTSGSTGSPQTVRLSYNNLISNAKAIFDYFKINKKDRAITTLPMNYTLGLSIINTHLYRGASITLTNFSVVQKEFWDLIKNNKITTFTGVPFTFEILKRVMSGKKKLFNLKYVTQAGGKLSSELVKYFFNFFKRKKIKFYVMYGQTEATARMSILNFNKVIKNPESIGSVIRGGKFSLIDENGNLIKKNSQAGELVYYGDNVSLGYANNCLDLKKRDENNRVLKTGDISYRNKDNLYFIVGRKKRFIKINGIRINLDAVETLFKKAKISSICKGQDDKLELYCLKSQFNKNIIEKIFKKLKIRPVNYRIYKINRIPRNQSGKIIYRNNF